MQPKNTYFPERFRQICPFSGEVAKRYAEESRRLGAAMFFHYEQMVPLVGEVALSHFRKAIADMSLDEAISAPEQAVLEKRLSEMMVMSVWYARFCYYGKQIFEVSGPLTDEFLHTDIDALIASDLVFPFPVFYLHFGARDDLRLEAGRIEGAYIQEIKPGVQYEINICLEEPGFESPPEKHSWLKEPRGWHTLSLDLSDPNRALSQVVMQSINADRFRMAKPSEKLDDESDRDFVLRSIAGLNGRDAVAFEVLRLVANALIYLDQIGLQSREERALWPSDTPKGMLEKLAGSATNPKQAAKIRSQLLSMGFTPVHLLREPEPAPGDPMASGDRARMSAHWRRGHWRRQAYGEGRAQRKLIRIRPVWVGGAIPGADPGDGGRAYQVTPARGAKT